MTVLDPEMKTSKKAMLAKSSELSIVDGFAGVVPGNYPGGKNGSGVYQHLINQIPPHEVYIEPFLGSGAVLRNKKMATVSYGVERSVNTFEMWSGHSLPGVTVIHGDAISWMREYQWQGGEFVYCDPPYVMSTRTSGEIYDHEMTDEQHIDLLETLLAMSAAGVKIMVSGYYSELYGQYLQGWRYGTFQAMTRGGVRTESLWLNYDEPAALHDYRFLGNDYRDRERIKRKINRKVRQLRELPRLERLAILEAFKAEFEGE